jgi:uncharacterized protein
MAHGVFDKGWAMELSFVHRLGQRSYFFDSGIRFECRQCGACCGGDPGTIYLSSSEVSEIAGYLNMTAAEWVGRFCYPYKDSYSLGEDAQGRCRLFDNGCAVYPVRPMQCRTFPFWFSNLRSIERWRKIAQACPGIGYGRHYDRDQILAIARSTLHI